MQMKYDNKSLIPSNGKIETSDPKPYKCNQLIPEKCKTKCNENHFLSYKIDQKRIHYCIKSSSNLIEKNALQLASIEKKSENLSVITEQPFIDESNRGFDKENEDSENPQNVKKQSIKEISCGFTNTHFTRNLKPQIHNQNRLYKLNAESAKSRVFINNDDVNYSLNNCEELKKFPMHFIHDMNCLGVCYVRTCSYFTRKLKVDVTKGSKPKDFKQYYHDGDLIEDNFIECFALRLRNKQLNHIKFNDGYALLNKLTTKEFYKKRNTKVGRKTHKLSKSLETKVHRDIFDELNYINTDNLKHYSLSVGCKPNSNMKINLQNNNVNIFGKLIGTSLIKRAKLKTVNNQFRKAYTNKRSTGTFNKALRQSLVFSKVIKKQESTIKFLKPVENRQKQNIVDSLIHNFTGKTSGKDKKPKLDDQNFLDTLEEKVDAYAEKQKKNQTKMSEQLNSDECLMIRFEFMKNNSKSITHKQVINNKDLREFFDITEFYKESFQSKINTSKDIIFTQQNCTAQMLYQTFLR